MRAMGRRAGLGSAARRQGFWLRDRLRGGRVRGHCAEIRGALSGRWSPEAPLRALLEHAAASAAFYEPYRGQSLPDFPVISKAVVKQDEAAFRSRVFAGARLHRQTSSGSTGEPFVVLQDRGKRERSIADTIVFNELAGLRLGERLMWLFAARLVPMSWRKQLIQNIIAVDHVGLDERASARIVDRLARGDVVAMLGINSSFQVLARFVQEEGIDPTPLALEVVIATGEDLPAADRDRIAAAFGCPVVNRYSTQEHGILAMTEPGGDQLRLNHGSYHFEFLRLDRDARQVPGKLARVVITDIYNRATPMIRYDTGDLAIVEEVDEGGKVRWLSSIEGRRADVVFDTTGGQVASPSISGVLVGSFPQLRRYQLIQEDRASYRLLVVQGTERYPEADIADELRRWLGPDATIEVRSVEDIEPLASGKHRPVVGHYRPPGSGS